MVDGVWHHLAFKSGDGHIGVAAKLVEQDDGRFVVREMYLYKQDRITSSDLRLAQPGRFEAMANTQGGALERIRLEHQRTHGEPEPTLDDLRSGFIALDEIMARQDGGQEPRRPLLTRPDGTDPEGFYRRVADAYQEYLKTTRAPATAIAEEAGVPVGTVYRWIREARRLDYLPKGERGRAG